MKKQISLALAFLVLAGCSATPKKRSLGEVIDDSVISNKLKVKYLRDKTVKGLKINIDTWKGVVTLRGKVDSQMQIDRAVNLAERQPGVREIKSYLVIKGPSRHTVISGPVEEQPVPETPAAELKNENPELSADGDRHPFDDEPPQITD